MAQIYNPHINFLWYSSLKFRLWVQINVSFLIYKVEIIFSTLIGVYKIKVNKYAHEPNSVSGT